MIPLCATQYRDRIVGAMQGQTIARVVEDAPCPKHRGRLKPEASRVLFTSDEECSLRAMQERSLRPWADGFCLSKPRELFYIVFMFSLLCEQGRTSFARACPKRSEGMQDRFLEAI